MKVPTVAFIISEKGKKKKKKKLDIQNTGVIQIMKEIKLASPL